jgi:hypothetical protein
MGHGILMGVLSIMAGMMLTLAVAANDISEHDGAAQAAVVMQPAEPVPVDSDDSRKMHVIVQLIERATSDANSQADSDTKALQIYLTPVLPAAR